GGGSGRHSAHRARTTGRRRMSRRALAGAGAGVLLVAVCAFGAWQWWSASERSDAPPASVAESPAPLGAVPSIVATVPDDIRATGRLVIAVNVPYAPNEFKDSDDRIVGFDIDLMNAIAKTLGLVPEYRESAFEAIIPSLRAGDFDVGMSSFTDTKEREAAVDFVTYFEAGTLWAQPAGASVDPDNACGLRVGVAYAAIQETQEIPAKSDACVAAGMPPIEKVVYVRQDDVNAALVAGEIDAMSADSPVTGFAIKLSGGALEAAGGVVNPAPYGWPVAKGSELAESLRQAMEHLIQTGEYRTIATMWGVEQGMIDEPVINGAIG
ncbi:ABC transporter substrate-binding protein, partial [Mycobacterium sp.]|uniref:ABC transporter substrate-binding protein n=1 Tax=Mycobacterium sp. TaxID=1785 RepID=UPI003C76E38F